MTRRTALCFVAVICLLMPACAKAPKTVNQKNFDAIKEGMTRAEVESLLGGPGEDYQGTDAGEAGLNMVGATGMSLQGGGRSALQWTRWGNDYTYILVCFVRDKVHNTDFKKSKGLK